MMRIYIFIICCLFGFSDFVFADSFGYITATTYNIGDDIQGLAAEALLPKGSIPINRDLVSLFSHETKVSTILNGWYMCTKTISWTRKDIKAPEKSWPPAAAIDPLLISIFFTPKFQSTAFNEEGIAYLKANGPVGARDHFTLKELEKRGIPCYFSGCLTLTMDNPYTEREDVIYAVDIDDTSLAYLKAHTKAKVLAITHRVPKEIVLNEKQRKAYAEGLLNQYRKAKAVVTTRLHAALPCLAFETPVLLLQIDDKDHRFDGLKELVRSTTKEDFVQGKTDFDFDNPSENPKGYLAIRSDLKKRVADWVAKKTKVSASS